MFVTYGLHGLRLATGTWSLSLCSRFSWRPQGVFASHEPSELWIYGWIYSDFIVINSDVIVIIR